MSSFPHSLLLPFFTNSPIPSLSPIHLLPFLSLSPCCFYPNPSLFNSSYFIFTYQAIPFLSPISVLPISLSPCFFPPLTSLVDSSYIYFSHSLYVIYYLFTYSTSSPILYPPIPFLSPRPLHPLPSPAWSPSISFSHSLFPSPCPLVFM